MVICMNCKRVSDGAYYYGNRLTCPHCLVEIWPMYYSCVVPLNDKDAPMQSYNQLLCYPRYDQMINSPIPVPPVPGYGHPYEQIPPHVEHNGLPPTAPSYSNSSNGSTVHSVNSVDCSEVQSIVNDLSPSEIPGNNRLNDMGSKDAQMQSYNQWLCYAGYDQMMNSPTPVSYGNHYEQMPPHVEQNGSPSSLVIELSPSEIPGNIQATECLKNLAALLKGNVYISHPMRRKLGKLINCPLNDEENRVLALSFCFSLGERVIFELMRDSQNLQDSISNLLASIRSKGCQFLGLPMQDEILKLILQALQGGENKTRKELVTFVLECLQQHRQTSKKKIGDVVQLLYRACCFNITKRDEESALMQLKENLRDYKTLREQHDAQVVQIATDAGIRISIDNWALLLYNDVSYIPYMESIIAKLKSKSTFEELVKQFEMFAQRRSNVVHLKRFSVHLKNLADIGASGDPETTAEVKVTKALDEIYHIVREIAEYKQQYKNRERERVTFPEEQHRRNQSTKSYKVRLCRNVALYRNCPRGNSCNFAHSREYDCNRNIS